MIMDNSELYVGNNHISVENNQLESIINQTKKYGWTEELISKYLKASSQKENIDKSNFEIRKYNEIEDKNKIYDLLNKIDHGEHSIEKLEKNNAEIIVKYDFESDKIIGVIAYDDNLYRRYIRIIAIPENNRRQGHAKDLTEYVINDSIPTTLKIHQDNYKSLELADSLGFEEDSIENNYIRFIRHPILAAYED